MRALKWSHADLPVVFGSVGDGDPTHLEISGENRFLLKGEKTAAGEISGDDPVDFSFLHFDRTEKLHLGPFLNKESAAFDFSGDFAGAPNDEVATALGIVGEGSFHDEIVALDRSGPHQAFFVDVDRSAGLDWTGPRFVNVPVGDRDHAAAISALGGVREDVGCVDRPAFEASDIAGDNLALGGAFARSRCPLITPIGAGRFLWGGGFRLVVGIGIFLDGLG